MRISRTGLFRPAHRADGASARQRGHGAGPLGARHAPPQRPAGPWAPSLHGHYPASPVVWADPTSHLRYPPLRSPLELGSTGAPVAAVGSPGFRALPVPACRRLRPRWTQVRSGRDERPLLPSPPLHTGRRPRWRGFRGWSRSLPRAFADFGPQSSCLRFARAVTPPDARLGPSDRVARPVAGGTSCSHLSEQGTHWEAPT